MTDRTDHNGLKVDADCLSPKNLGPVLEPADYWEGFASHIGADD
jgi:hypothetical protein